MSARVKNGADFAFTAANKKWAAGQISKYPPARQKSAVMPLLTRAQDQNGGWLSRAAIEHVAQFLGMPVIRVLELATFYSMYNLRPVGKHVVEICTTTPCWLRGSDAVAAAAKEELGIDFGGTTSDGAFTLLEVECLGACVNAPACAVHRKYYEDLDAQSMRAIIRALRDGKIPDAGPQIDRQKSAPANGPGGGPTTLKEMV